MKRKIKRRKSEKCEWVLVLEIGRNLEIGGS